MTPSRDRLRKARTPWHSTARRRVAAGLRHARRLLERLGTIDHPGNPETIRAHAESSRPEGFLERHGDSAALGERAEDPLGFSGLRDLGEHAEALRSLIAISRCVAAGDRLRAELEARMDDLIASLRRGLRRGGGLAVGHREGDATPQGPGVKAEGFAAVTLEVQVGNGLHESTP